MEDDFHFYFLKILTKKPKIKNRKRYPFLFSQKLKMEGDFRFYFLKISKEV